MSMEITVDCGTHDLHVEVHGEGEPLVFIPAWGLSTGASFERTVPEFLRSRYRVITYDHRGLGRSTDTPEAENSTKSYAQDVIEICRALDVSRAHVVGYGGLGACIAQYVALAEPDLAQSLVLISGWAGPEPYHHAQQEIFRVLVDKADYRAFQTYMAIICYTPEYINERGVIESQGVREPGDIQDRPEAHLRLITANMEHDAREELPEIAAPTLVVYPELDLLGGPRLADELLALMPNSRRCELTGAPHVFSIHPGASEKFVSEVVSFLREHAATA